MRHHTKGSVQRTLLTRRMTPMLLSQSRTSHNLKAEQKQSNTHRAPLFLMLDPFVPLRKGKSPEKVTLSDHYGVSITLRKTGSGS